MDRTGGPDFFSAVDSMKDKLHANALPVQCPIGAEGNFKGVVDLITMKAYVFKDESLGAEYTIEEIPEDLKEKCQEMRTHLLDELATIDESNEDFMMKVLESPDTIPEEEIHAVIRKGVCEGKIHPVLCGTAL